MLLYKKSDKSIYNVGRVWVYVYNNDNAKLRLENKGKRGSAGKKLIKRGPVSKF